jgi:cation transport regulator
MPYATNDDLPVSLQRHLPPHAQDIYREAFNHGYASHPGEEARAHRIAWAAVKRSYVKVGESWVARSAVYDDAKGLMS